MDLIKVNKFLRAAQKTSENGSESAQYLRAAMYGSIEPKPPGRDESWMIQASSDYKEIDWVGHRLHDATSRNLASLWRFGGRSGFATWNAAERQRQDVLGKHTRHGV